MIGPLLILGRSDGQGPGLLLPIVATAVVAVLFEPIRARMQRWANRLVYGDRATPHDVLSQVTSRLADGEGGAVPSGDQSRPAQATPSASRVRGGPPRTGTIRSDSRGR